MLWGMAFCQGEAGVMRRKERGSHRKEQIAASYESTRRCRFRGGGLDDASMLGPFRG